MDIRSIFEAVMASGGYNTSLINDWVNYANSVGIDRALQDFKQNNPGADGKTTNITPYLTSSQTQQTQQQPAQSNVRSIFEAVMASGGYNTSLINDWVNYANSVGLDRALQDFKQNNPGSGGLTTNISPYLTTQQQPTQQQPVQQQPVQQQPVQQQPVQQQPTITQPSKSVTSTSRIFTSGGRGGSFTVYSDGSGEISWDDGARQSSSNASALSQAYGGFLSEQQYNQQLASQQAAQQQPAQQQPVQQQPVQQQPVQQQPVQQQPVQQQPVQQQPTQTGAGFLTGQTPAAGGIIPGGENIQFAPLRPTGAAGGESRIDPTLRPYLEMGLQRAEQLFFGQPQPTLFPGQMYVSPSAQTEAALTQQEAIARAQPIALQAAQESYLQGLGGLSATAGGAFLMGNPFQQAAIQAATRPISQQFEQQILPGVSSQFSRAGRYGSGAMERAVGTATEATGRAIGDVAANIAYQDYAAERQRQQQAIGAQIQGATLAPQIYAQQFLPSQQLAQVGAAREAIAAQPLQEAIQRYQFSQQLPYQQLQGFLSSVYGTPLAGSNIPTQQAQGNTTLQNIGGLLSTAAAIPGAVSGLRALGSLF